MKSVALQCYTIRDHCKTAKDFAASAKRPAAWKIHSGHADRLGLRVHLELFAQECSIDDLQVS